MSDRYLKKAAKTPETETEHARARSSPKCSPPSRLAASRRCATMRPEARWLVGRDRAECRRDRTADRATFRRRSRTTSSSRPTRCAASPTRSAPRSRTFALEISPGLELGQKLVPVNTAGLLRADRPLRAYRLGLHVDRDRQGGGRQDRDRLLGALQGRGHSSACALRHEGRGRRHHHEPRRRAGHRRHGVRPVHRVPGRHHRRAGQQVRRRSQAHAVRQGRHRRASPAPPRSPSSPTTAPIR